MNGKFEYVLETGIKVRFKVWFERCKWWCEKDVLYMQRYKYVSRKYVL